MLHQISEIMRRIDNLIQIGTVSEADPENRALARVTVLGRVTPWLPVVMLANAYKQTFSPVRTGEQVLVLCPGGQADGGVVIRGLFNTGCKEPPGVSGKVEKTTYEDGTWLAYDTENSALTGHINGDVTMSVTGNMTLNVTGNVDLDADGTVTCDAPAIHMNQGTGVVTGECICHFTGNPHGDLSSTVTAGK